MTPRLVIPFDAYQTADDAVLAYVRERMNVHDAAAALADYSQFQAFEIAARLAARYLKDGETLKIIPQGDDPPIFEHSRPAPVPGAGRQ